MSKSPKVITYKSEGWEYRANFSGPLNAQKTVLKGRWVQEYSGTRGPLKKALTLLDHGNGVHLTGEGISLELDYSQVADLYHVLDAHNLGNEGWMWGTFDVEVKEVKERKSRKKKVDKKAKKK